MRRLWKCLLFSAVLGAVLPLTVIELVLYGRSADTPDRKNTEAYTITVQLDTGENIFMDLEDYVADVVYAEMPASFEAEALKAQAVAARTYAWKTICSGKKHSPGVVCTESACCQAFCSLNHTEADAWIREKIRSAVTETGGQVLTYDGALIDAVYSSCSGGSTEDAQAVWGTWYPYLVAAESPGEEEAPVYQDRRSFDAEQLGSLLGVSLTGHPGDWITDIQYTNGGGIASLVLQGRRYTGTEFRRILQLRSTKLEFQPADTELTIVSYGYGHRVGMSQYGAQVMAENGKDYRQILAHYYIGTELTQISDLSG